MSSKIRIKMGQLEIEYEGAEEFLKKELPALLQTVSKLYQLPSTDGGSLDPVINSSNLKLTTANIAAKINCKSGNDLVIAACAQLSLIQKKDTYDRKSILSEMKGASGYYKGSYRDNLTSYLSSLVKSDKLTETSRHNYSLHANTLKDINARINK